MALPYASTRSVTPEEHDDDEDIICNICGIDLCPAHTDTFEVLTGGLIPLRRCTDCKFAQSAKDALAISRASFVANVMAHVDAGRIDNEEPGNFSQRVIELLDERLDDVADREVFLLCLERLAEHNTRKTEQTTSGHKRKQHDKEEEHASEAPAAKVQMHDHKGRK